MGVMTSKKIYPVKYHLVLEALELQAEEELSELAPLERDLSARSILGDVSDPEQREYRAKGALRSLELMGRADEKEI